jgi:hypothetical protein
MGKWMLLALGTILGAAGALLGALWLALGVGRFEDSERFWE